MKKSKELCSLWNNEQELQTGNVKISELHEFKGHPFRVEHDMLVLCQLVVVYNYGHEKLNIL